MTQTAPSAFAATWQFAGVIFDMDGVLVDSEPFICEAACLMFAERYRVTVDPADFVPFIGTGENHYLGGVAAKYGVTLSMPDDKAFLYDAYLRCIPGRLKPMTGSIDFVHACRRRGLRTAVGTSADRIKLDGNLAEIGLPADSFHAIVTGSEVERKKPFPDLFLLAASKLGLPAKSCLVIEDAPEGVRAAVAAGCTAVGLTSSFDEAALRAAGARWVTSDLASLPADVLGLA